MDSTIKEEETTEEEMYTQEEMKLAHRSGLFIGGFFGFAFAFIVCLLAGIYLT